MILYINYLPTAIEKGGEFYFNFSEPGNLLIISPKGTNGTVIDTGEVGIYTKVVSVPGQQKIKVHNNADTGYYDVYVLGPEIDGIYSGLTGNVTINEFCNELARQYELDVAPKTSEEIYSIIDAIIHCAGSDALMWLGKLKVEEAAVPSPTPTVTLTPTSTPTSSPIPTPTVTSTPTPTPSPSPTPIITPTPTVTPSPTPTGKPKLRITHELSAKTGEILLTTCIENIGEGEAKDVKLTMGVPSQIKAENLVGISAVGNTLVWAGELKPGEKHIIKQSIIPLKNEDIEIPLTVSYIDPTTHELITWDTIIKIIAGICCLFCDDKCCEVMAPTLGIGATVAAFGIVYLLVRQRRKL